jgi:two-component system response regulator MprA
MGNEKKSILVVEDDKLILRAFKGLLQENGYTVDTAETGNQALQKIRAKDYDAAIFDITLPDISGIELLQKIPKETSSMFKIVMAEFSAKEMGQLAADSGADEYLVKPVSHQELLKLLKDLFS